MGDGFAERSEASNDPGTEVRGFGLREGLASQNRLGRSSFAADPDEPARIGFQESSAIVSAPQFAADEELDDGVSTEVDAQSTVAAETGDDQFWFVFRGDFNPFDECSGFPQDVFSIEFDAGHGDLLACRKKLWDIAAPRHSEAKTVLEEVEERCSFMQIWPAIDLRGGKCVRLQQGDYGRETVFGDDPAEMAARWIAEGAEYLHLVDLDGARDGQLANRQAVAQILQRIAVPCELGGGIRDEGTIREWLDAGLTRLVVGTKALKEPAWFREMCHRFPQRLCLGLDARNGLVATDGWLETSTTRATELASQFADLPIAAIIYTDIAKDGMMAGPNFEGVAEMRRAVPIPVIASGGVTTVEDVRRLAREGTAGCIIGRTLYEGKLSIAEALAAARQHA